MISLILIIVCWILFLFYLINLFYPLFNIWNERNNLLWSVSTTWLSLWVFFKIALKYEFDKNLEYYKSEYQKSIKNFDLYYTEKHKAYKELLKTFFDENLHIIWPNDFFPIGQYQNKTQEEINSIIDKYSYNDDQKQQLITIYGNEKEKFYKIIYSYELFENINNNIPRIQKFKKTTWLNKIYFDKSIILVLERICKLFDEYLDCYNEIYWYKWSEDSDSNKHLYKAGEGSREIKGSLNNALDSLIVLIQEELSASKPKK